ncbi:MAG TPA: hypothetical protein PKX92_01185 [Edaphocola sp.]|nr:hypothetical protein [Edaphocola sp.]
MENNPNLDQDNIEENTLQEVDNPQDLRISKPKTSRLFFLLSFFGFFIFAWSGCYNLYKHKYVSQKDKVEVNESSLYAPKYK